MIAIIAILAAILFPVFARARENARRASCQSNLKQVALGMFQYTQDYDEKFPQAVLLVSGGIADPTTASPTNPYGWADAIQPYLKSTQIYQCPSESTAATTTAAAPWNGAVNPTVGDYTDYWFNIFLSGKSQAAVDSVSLTVMNGDSNPNVAFQYYDGTKTNNGSSNAAAVGPITGLGVAHLRHLDGANFAFADGHVKWQKGDGAGTTASCSAVLNGLGTAASGKPYFNIN